ncbi:hypothetical protein ANN_24709, partial [Periplaneta americana]
DLAEKLWDVAQLQLPTALCEELLNDVIHPVDEIQHAGAQALAALLKQENCFIDDVLEKLLAIYQEKLAYNIYVATCFSHEEQCDHWGGTNHLQDNSADTSDDDVDDGGDHDDDIVGAPTRGDVIVTLVTVRRYLSATEGVKYYKHYFNHFKFWQQAMIWPNTCIELEYISPLTVHCATQTKKWIRNISKSVLQWLVMIISLKNIGVQEVI